MTVDAANGGSNFVFNGLPHDWTEGTGVFPASGVITLSNPATINGKTRVWLLIQNQDATDITVKVNATLADGVTLTNAAIIIPNGGGVSTAGGVYENYHQLLSLVGVIIVTGTPGNKVLVLERRK